MEICRNIIPTDKSTLFICSGMQELKPRFQNPDNTVYSSLQSCIRTNDLQSIGDGTHLSSFEMIGNFSFGPIPYEKSCEMWLEIMEDLQIMPDYITFHKTQESHGKFWTSLGQKVVESDDCVWSDGNIGGYCTELFKNDVEIGNLVNTLSTMTDVGFGMERILMFVEGRDRVDTTSVFPENTNPILRDHLKTINLLWENGVSPGNKGKNYITRLLVRRCLFEEVLSGFSEYEFFKWFEDEYIRKEKSLLTAKSNVRRHFNKTYDFWFDTFGLVPLEVDQLKQSFLSGSSESNSDNN